MGYNSALKRKNSTSCDNMMDMEDVKVREKKLLTE